MLINTTSKFLNFLYLTLKLGWIAFPAIAFIAPDLSIWKNFFYLTIILPSILILVLNESRQLIPCKNVTPTAETITKHYWLNLIKTHQIFLLATISCLYLSISTLWSTNEDQLYLTHFLKLSFFILVYLYAGCLLAKKYTNVIIHSLNTILIFGCIALSITVASYIYQYSANLSQRLEGIWLLTNPLVAAQFFGILCLIASHKALESTQQKKTLVYIIIASIAAATVLWTRSRGPSAYLLICFLFLLFTSNKITRKTSLVIVITAIVMLIASFVVFPELKNTLFNRSLSITRRLEIWTTLLSNAKDSLLFGTGASKYLSIQTAERIYHHAHSSWVETLYYSGVTGLIISASLILATIKAALTKPYHRLLLSWFIFGLLCLTTNGHFLISKPGWQWAILWIPLAFIYTHSLMQENAEKSDNP